jgi:hypothetical protein
MIAHETLEGIESAIDKLSLTDQVWLIERLAQKIRRQTLRQQPDDEQFAAMAADPDIQKELRAIEADLAGTEANGLRDEV